jgi:polyferredoxin
MTKKNAKRIQIIRIVSQVVFTVLFFVLLIASGHAAAKTFTYTDAFFYFDPLLLLVNFLATGTVATVFLLSLIPVVLTLIFGRFFCGWVCPLGAINQLFTRIFKKSRKEKRVVNKKLLKAKYVILFFVLAFALVDTHIAGWFDPFSLLTRSSAVAINPAVNHVVENSLKKGAMDDDLVSKGLKPLYTFSRKHILTNKQRAFVQSVFIGMIFLLILGLNLYKKRFYCNYICPLGALYGLLAKFSILNLKIKDTCKSCNVCANNCTYNGSPYQDYMKSECMVCYNCFNDCPHQAIENSFEPPKKSNITHIDIGRRKMVGSLAGGLFLGSLPKISQHGKKRTHSFTRPPGSVPEDEFLQKCIRCGQCMQVCPTNLIQPALFESGTDGLWTPVLNPSVGYCEYECNKCTQVCPTEAIQKLTLKEKKEFKIGTSVIDRNRCYTYADGYNCAVCEEHCPVPDKAIKFREVDVWNFDGKLVKVKQIYIIPDRCIGCGHCENVCPRSDAPGILLSAEEEQREELAFY